MQHVDLASSAERMVEARQVKQASSSVQSIASRNPWWWAQMSDIASPLVDYAKIGLTPDWGGLPMPPPLHHGISSGVDHILSVNGTGGAPVYGVAGATTDGRTAIECTGNGTTGQYFNTAAWANPDDPPLPLAGNGVMTWFFRYKRIAAGGHWMMSMPTQLGSFGIAASGGGALLLFCRDSGSGFASHTFATTLDDGNWHDVGWNWSGSNVTQNLLAADVFVDGVEFGSGSVSSVAAQGPWQGEAHNWYIFNSTDTSATSPGGGFALQDCAIFPQGLVLADFAAIFAAR